VPADTEDQKLRTLIYVLLALTCLVVTANAARYAGEVMVAGAVLHAMLDLRERLYHRILRMPMSFFANQATSELITHFVQDIQEIQRGL
jgi:subfamily B ATP-binding cassette protein MsbA